MNNSFEYVTVNGNKDLWEIDYKEGEARYTESKTLDDLIVNNEEYTDLGEHSIYDYLESNGYIIHNGISSEEYIKFEKGEIDQ